MDWSDFIYYGDRCQEGLSYDVTNVYNYDVVFFCNSIFGGTICLDLSPFGDDHYNL